MQSLKENELIVQKSFTNDEINFFMKIVLEICNKAIVEKEVPVGCLFVHIPTKQIIISSHNLTNKFRNATKHAEINCFDQINLISKDKSKKSEFSQKFGFKNENINLIFSECALFVSCEPCIMCAYALSLMSK